MTLEWRHGPPIWTNNKGLQETPPRAQFLSYDQLFYSIWRRISRATKLLSGIFQIWKIPKKIKKKILKILYFRNIFPLNTKFSQKHALSQLILFLSHGKKSLIFAWCIMLLTSQYHWPIRSHGVNKWAVFQTPLRASSCHLSRRLFAMFLSCITLNRLTYKPTCAFLYV